MHYIDPDRKNFQEFKGLPRDHPIDMLNLIKLHDQAQYPDGRASSGADAYARYGKFSGPIFQRVGGKIIWRGSPQVVLIGPDSDLWDIAFIARYPTAGAFLEMVTDTTYQSEAVPHRQAAVLNSRLIRHQTIEAGETFG